MLKSITGACYETRVSIVDMGNESIVGKAGTKASVTPVAKLNDAHYTHYSNFVNSLAEVMNVEDDPQQLYTNPKLLAEGLNAMAEIAVDSAPLLDGVDQPLVDMFSRVGYHFVVDEAQALVGTAGASFLQQLVQTGELVNARGDKTVKLLPGMIHWVWLIENPPADIAPSIDAAARMLLTPKVAEYDAEGRKVTQPALEIESAAGDAEQRWNARNVTRVLNGASIRGLRLSRTEHQVVVAGAADSKVSRLTASSLIPAGDARTEERARREYAHDVVDKVAQGVLPTALAAGFTAVDVKGFVVGLAHSSPSVAAAATDARTGAFTTGTVSAQYVRHLCDLLTSGDADCLLGGDKVFRVTLRNTSGSAEEAAGLAHSSAKLESPGLASRAFGGGAPRRAAAAGAHASSPLVKAFMDAVVAGGGGPAMAWARTQGDDVFNRVLLYNISYLQRWWETDSAKHAGQLAVAGHVFGAFVPAEFGAAFVRDTARLAGGAPALSVAGVLDLLCGCRLTVLVPPGVSDAYAAACLPCSAACTPPQKGGTPVVGVCVLPLSGEAGVVGCAGRAHAAALGVRLVDHGRLVGLKSYPMARMVVSVELLSGIMGEPGTPAAAGARSAAEYAKVHTGGERGRDASQASDMSSRVVSGSALAEVLKVETRSDVLRWLRSEAGVQLTSKLGRVSAWSLGSGAGGSGAGGSGAGGSGAGGSLSVGGSASQARPSSLAAAARPASRIRRLSYGGGSGAAAQFRRYSTLAEEDEVAEEDGARAGASPLTVFLSVNLC